MPNEINILELLRKFLFRFSIAFLLLFIFSVPFDSAFIFDFGKLTSRYFEIFIRWSGDYIFKIKSPYIFEIISDSTGMYLHAFNLFIVSIVFSMFSSKLFKANITYEKTEYWFHVIISYYLSLVLFKYGFYKIFKNQFYLPEPNILFTPLGDLSDDILYWSTMGASYYFSLITGILEVIPAILLLFKRSRHVGAMIAMVVMTQVVIINFCFDISVKMYACFLLFLCIILVYPTLKLMYQLIILGKETKNNLWLPVFNSKHHLLSYFLLKIVIIGLIVFEALFPFIDTNNFNDDKAMRPYLHGAYDVEVFIRGSDTIPPLTTEKERFKRIFIHRKSYFITQNMKDEMNDYLFKYDLKNKQLILFTERNSTIFLNFSFSERDSVLTLSGTVKKVKIKIIAKQIDWKKMQLFQKQFHWTID